uniref:Cyclin N-terminal domain-containing protein n=1 Tax=Prymnesium polylepis TaxID=72548 RepID=A0A7S4HK39_9EUKA
MRAILVDWLVDVQLKFKLKTETLYLAVGLIDRYLEVHPVVRAKLQLVGISAMYLASMYEEGQDGSCPEVRRWVYICDNAYRQKEISDMHRRMAVFFSERSFSLSTPNAVTFLEQLQKQLSIGKNSEAYLLSQFYAELTLQEYKMLGYRPSLIAASAVYIALDMVADQSMPCSIEYPRQTSVTCSAASKKAALLAGGAQATWSTEKALLPCVGEMRRLDAAPQNPKLNAVARKYQKLLGGEPLTRPADRGSRA